MKAREGTDHPDRDEFHHINDQVKPDSRWSPWTPRRRNYFKNSGREWRPKGSPEEVRAMIELGKAIPYGVYDVINNVGWVNVGVSSDTAAFAVESIRRWLGKERYPEACKLLITADCGGWEPRRLWKVELQKLARELGIQRVPPATRQQVEQNRAQTISQNGAANPSPSHHHRPEQRPARG